MYLHPFVLYSFNRRIDFSFDPSYFTYYSRRYSTLYDTNLYPFNVIREANALFLLFFLRSFWYVFFLSQHYCHICMKKERVCKINSSISSTKREGMREKKRQIYRTHSVASRLLNEWEFNVNLVYPCTIRKNVTLTRCVDFFMYIRIHIYTYIFTI